MRMMTVTIAMIMGIGMTALFGLVQVGTTGIGLEMNPPIGHGAEITIGVDMVVVGAIMEDTTGMGIEDIIAAGTMEGTEGVITVDTVAAADIAAAADIVAVVGIGVADITVRGISLC